MTEDRHAWSKMVATVDTLVNNTQGEKVRTRIVIYRTICYSSLNNTFNENSVALSCGLNITWDICYPWYIEIVNIYRTLEIQKQWNIGQSVENIVHCSVCINIRFDITPQNSKLFRSC